MWKNGRKQTVLSPGSSEKIFKVWSILVDIFRWVRITPLGNPVVPEE